MKKFLRYTIYTILAFIALIVLYLGCAWVLARIPIRAESNTRPDLTLYLMTNGVHTDLVLPVKTADKDWSRCILYKNTRSGDTAFRYVAFGWGDKAFYLETPTWGDLKARTALRAIFGLSSAAMHASFYKDIKEDERCIRLDISKEQYRRLVFYIGNSLQSDSLGNPIAVPTKVRYGDNDAFYEAKGRYSLFHTCNTWVNDGLKVSGQKACWWTPFDKGIFYQYK